MADADGGGGSKLSVGGFISPGIGIVKSWQGIVEISLRGVLIVLALFTMIACGVTQSAAGNAIVESVGDLSRNIASASGWLTFVAVVVFLYEIVFILQRFLNVSIINSHIKIALVIDSIVHGVVAVSLFAGAVALATYIPDVKSLSQGMFASTFARVVSAAEATCVFAFFLMILVIATTVYILLGVFIFNWSPTLAKYTSSGSGGGDGGE